MLGITTPLRRELGSAIGTSEVHMLEHAAAYGVFATQGIYREASPIVRVADSNGKVIYQHQDPGRRVVNAQVTYVLNDILAGYAKEWKLNLMGPAAGKSGTTDDHADLWYMGYTPDLVVGTWMAHTGRNPNGSAIGRYKLDFSLFGVTTAALMFRDFLPVYYNGRAIPTFEKPPGMTNTTSCHTQEVQPAPPNPDQNPQPGEGPAAPPQPTTQTVCTRGDLHIAGTSSHPPLTGTYSPPGTYVIPAGR
jgi:penicillin-binding protein 1A